MGTLYMLTSPAGKSYIGISSKTTEDRWAKHVEHALGKRESGALYAALRKYGHENFKLVTLVIADDWDYLCELERRAIAAFGTLAPAGYNMTLGGEGVVGPRGEDFRAKVAKAQKVRFANPEERRRMKRIAESIDPKTRAIAHAKAAATMRTPEYRERASARTKAQFASEESRERARAAGIAAMTDERRADASERMKLVMAEPEQRRMISEATKAAMRKPETANKVKQAAIERAADPEWRTKISESKKGQGLGEKRPKEWVEKQRAGVASAWSDPVKKAARLEKLRATRARKELEAALQNPSEGKTT